MYEIYVITNAVNDKKYVGQTCRGFNNRWSQHKSCAKQGSDNYFYRAIRKHGAENFSIRVVEYIETADQANEAEKKWIIDLQSLDDLFGYNSTHGGDGSLPSDFTKQKQSRTHKQMFADPEFKARMAAANVGKNHTEQGRQNIAKALEGNQYRKGIPHDEASKDKIRAGVLKAVAEGRRTSQKGVSTGRKGMKLGPMSDDRKKKHSEAMLGYKQSPEHTAKLKAIWAQKRLAKLQAQELVAA